MRWIIIAVLAVGIVGTGYWGYKEHQEKNQVALQAENTYQRSFHELSYHMDLLHDKLGTTLAMNSKERLSPQMVDIWRITSEAQANVGQLPFTLMPIIKTQELLADIGDFTYRTAVRDLDQNPLTDAEAKSLETLYRQSSEIKTDLRTLQDAVLQKNLRWMDVQVALANDDPKADKTIVDGFTSVEKKVKGYSEGNVDSAIIGTALKEHTYKNVKGAEISEQEAREKARKLFHLETDQDIIVQKSGKGSEVPIYNITYQDKFKDAHLDLTIAGGHPITLMMDREIKDKTISLNEGGQKAEAYLEQFELKDMLLFESNEFGNTGVYTFIYNKDDIRVFADAIQVKVALDTGDILGLSARNYFMNHTDRNFGEPKVSRHDALAKVNPNIKIYENHLAIIENDLGKEVLAYEFLGELNNETYRIFINAMDGREEKVEKLKDIEVNMAFAN